MSFEFTLIMLSILIISIAIIYNRIIKNLNLVHEGWSGIDVQLKRRYNLIPNLVATVKGYKDFEQETLLKVTEARSLCKASARKGEDDLENRKFAEQQLTDSIVHLFALAENYPDLKANKSFLDLQYNLADTENQIEMARRYFNATVRDYNTCIQVFPNLIIARVLGFTDKEYFEIEQAAERIVPELKDL